MRVVPLIAVAVALLLAGCSHGPAPDPVPEDGSAPPEVSWRIHPDAPTPRTEVAVAPLGGEVYVMGGFVSGSQAEGVVEVFDTTREAWRTAAQYPLPVHHTGTVSDGEQLYVFGGYVTLGFVPTNMAFAYDPAVDAWTPLPPLPLPRGAHAAVLLDGKVYLLGGVGIDGQMRAAVDVYDLETATWSTAPDLPTPREHLAAAALDGKILVAGGRMQSLSSNSGLLEVYDPEADRWTSGAPMPTPRGGIAAAAYDDRLVVVGGEANDGTFDDVEAYDPATDAWTTLPGLPTARHGLGATTVESRLYVMLGGPEPGLTLSGAAESLGPGADTA